MDEGYSAALIALLSIAFGWSLNAIGQWFGRRKGNHQIKNQVLFNLLDLHFIFLQLNMGDKIELGIKKMEAFAPTNDPMPQYVKDLISNLIIKSNVERVRVALENGEKAFEDSIENLAKIDPIRAYRLKGKSNIFLVFDSMQSYLGGFEEKLLEEGVNPEEINMDQIQQQVYSEFEPKIIVEGIADLQDEIKSLSWSINFMTRIKINRVIKNATHITSKESLKEYEAYLDTTLPKVISQVMAAQTQ